MKKPDRERVEVVGLCCTAHDLTRYEKKRARIVGPISWQLRFIRTGIPDVIVIDEQCIFTDIVEEAKKVGAIVLAASDKALRGLPDRTHSNPDTVVEELISGKIPGAVVLDEEKLAVIAVKTALKLTSLRVKYKWSLFDEKTIIEYSKKCVRCRNCERNCPQNLPISVALQKSAGETSHP